MSASDSSSPGGQPSTTAPIAGPWLSPKVVTQNERPIVFPDIFLILLARQVRGAQQENLGEPVLELEPHQRQVAKPPPHAARRVAGLDDEDAPSRQGTPG